MSTPRELTDHEQQYVSEAADEMLMANRNTFYRVFGRGPQTRREKELVLVPTICVTAGTIATLDQRDAVTTRDAIKDAIDALRETETEAVRA